jgi:hypothetical protein
MLMGKKITDRPEATIAFKASSALMCILEAYAFKELEFIFSLNYQFQRLGNASSNAKINEI